MSVSKNTTVSVADLELLARLSERIHDMNPNEPFLNHLYSVLKEAVPSTVFSIDSYSVSPLFFEQAASEIFSDELCAIYRQYMIQHPLLKKMMALRKTGVYTILSVTSSEKFHKTDLYQKFYKALGIEDQLAFRLMHISGAYLVVYSRDIPFSQKERMLMEMLKPQLHIALRNWQKIRFLEKSLRTLENKVANGERSVDVVFDSAHPVNLLTRRQRDVAELVAQGLENQQIAETLHIAPKTVGKHVENIFAALNIRNRTTLAAMWQQAKSANED
jgi:DNA-binding CsgD family transcriptional regulator